MSGQLGTGGDAGASFGGASGGHGGGAPVGGGALGGGLTGGMGSGGSGGIAGPGGSFGMGGMVPAGGGTAGMGSGGSPSYPARPVMAWGRLIGGPAQLMEGGERVDDHAFAVTMLSSDVVVAGSVVGTVNFGNGATSGDAQWSESYVAAYSPDNQYLWHHRFSSAGHSSNWASALAATLDGVRVAGLFRYRFDSTLGVFNVTDGFDGYVLTLSASGNPTHAAHLKDSMSLPSVCLAGEWVSGFTDGNLQTDQGAISGPSVFLTKLNAAQTGLTRGFASSGDPLFGDCASDAGGAAYLTGRAVAAADFGGGLLSATGPNDIFLASFNAAGNHRWSMLMGGSSVSEGKRVGASAQNVYLASAFEGALTVGVNASAAGQADILITAHDPSTGLVRWSRVIGSAANDTVMASVVDAQGNFLVAGYHRGAIVSGLDAAAVGPLASRGTFLASFSSLGGVNWAMGLGDLEVSGLAVAPDGSIYVVGTAVDPINVENATLTPDRKDGFLLKLEWR